MKLILASCALAAALFAATPAATGPGDQSIQSAAPDARLPGVSLAEGITQITGVAISPMLGVSAVGSWKYFRAPANQRHLLPWYCSPWVWGAGFVILALCFLKDSLGAAAPPLLKKPFDLAELLEDKCSALVASAAFVPLIAKEIATGAPEAAACFSDGSFFLAAIPIDARWLLIPLCVLGFLVVWLAAHAVNVIVALSPFGLLDAVLKLFKFGALASVVLASVINIYLGAALSLAILAVAVLIAPWAFRLTVFGSVLATDVIFDSATRRRATPSRPGAFLARKLEGVPVRTYGRLQISETGFVSFSYRPWLILPSRQVALPAGALIITKGLLWPNLILSPSERAPFPISLIAFPPRYRGREQEIADALGINEIQDGFALRGINAVRTWFRETVIVFGGAQPMPTTGNQITSESGK